MSKWVQMRQAQLAKQTANDTREMLRLQEEQASAARIAAEAQPTESTITPERVASLEARVAMLEARLQGIYDQLPSDQR
ncbi:unannotated protein [freshwater metagenome]|uniref:Unannotated protein n=1 Tax=freshwater metagenome TaxID=449393 RepID=A0A6J7K854_9ZZZZ